MSLNSALVVDDSKLARITLQRLLQKHNLSVEVAESGLVALEKLKSKKPDIIFMDHLMPDLDGFQATQKIKADPSTTHIPVIMCTGKEDTDNYDQQAREIGASGTLSKPPQADQLALILAAAQTGEQLVSTSQMPDGTRISSITTDTSIEKAADAQANNNSELAKIFERLHQLEQTSPRIPSLDALQQRLTDSENSLTTLQEAVISIKNDASQALPLSAEEISASVHHSLQAELFQELENFKENAIDLAAIKAELSGEFEALLNKKLEALPTDSGAGPAEVDEEALIARIMAEVESAINEKFQPSENTSEVDEEALAARLVEDVENTLKPLFTGELKELEQKLASATDDAISESRRDLDEHLQDSVRNMEMNMKAVPDEANLEDLLNRIRGEVTDIATHSAAAAVATSLEDRLAEINAAARAAASAASEENADGAQPQQIQELFDRITELDRQQETLLARVSEIKELKNTGAAGSAMSGGLVLGAIALAGAAVSLAKAFGLF